MSSLLIPLLLLGQAAAAPAEIRALTVTLLDKKDQAVTDVSSNDVALSENGVNRDIASFAPDTRPLTVVITVDTGAAFASEYRLNVVEAVVGKLKVGKNGSRGEAKAAA